MLRGKGVEVLRGRDAGAKRAEVQVLGGEKKRDDITQLTNT